MYIFVKEVIFTPGTKKAKKKKVYNLQMTRLAWGKKSYVLQNFWDLSEKWIFETEYCFNLLVTRGF